MWFQRAIRLYHTPPAPVNTLAKTGKLRYRKFVGQILSYVESCHLLSSSVIFCHLLSRSCQGRIARLIYSVLDFPSPFCSPSPSLHWLLVRVCLATFVSLFVRPCIWSWILPACTLLSSSLHSHSHSHSHSSRSSFLDFLLLSVWSRPRFTWLLGLAWSHG